MKHVRMTIWVGVVVCVCCFGLPKAMGDTIFDDGQIHNIDFEIDDNLGIRDNTSGTPTIVNLVADGIVTSMVLVYDNSTFNLAGGRVDNYILTSNNSHVNISSGSIAYDLRGNDNSVFTISGGAIGDDLLVNHNNQTLITGGSIGGELDVYGDSVVTIEGTGFNYAYGEITNPTGILTGTLANGDPIDNRFYVHDNAQIVLVPEPTTLLLLGLGGLMLRRKR